MDDTKRQARSGSAVFVACPWLLVSRGEAATVTVDWDTGSTIGAR
jgi:hypothetical protein